MKSNIFFLISEPFQNMIYFPVIDLLNKRSVKKKHRTGRAFYSNDENKNNNKLSQRYSISINFPLNFECVIEYLS